MFPLKSVLDNFTLDSSSYVLRVWKVGKKKQCYAVQNIEFLSKQPGIICLYFFVSPVQRQCPALNIIQALLFQFLFQKCINISIVALEVCMIVAFPPQSFVYFRILGYLLWTPDNLNFFAISLEGSSYRESTVALCWSFTKELISFEFRHYNRISSAGW